MRNTVSNHVQSTGTLAAHIWPDTDTDYGVHEEFRPNLNVALLATIISDIAEDSDDILTPNKKRKVSAESFESNKRSRTSQPSDSSYTVPLVPLKPTHIDPSYPWVEAKLNRGDGGPDLVPILRHVLEIQYVHEEVVSNVAGANREAFLDEDANVDEDDYADEDAGSDMAGVGPETVKEWKVQDENLRERLFSLSEKLTSPKSIALGEIMLGEYEHRCVGLSATNEEWLVILPPLIIDADSNDLSEGTNDLLQACQTLQSVGQVHLRAFLRLMVYPQDSKSQSFPTFSLCVDIDITLDIDAALQNDMPNKHKWTVAIFEEARRRLFRAAFTPQAVTSTDVNDPITVSSFYSILQPAPPLPSNSLELTIQPEGLLPSLLPFQRRSVAWLLEREGMALSSDGTLVKSPPKEYSFWDEIKEGNYRLYLNRLSGELDIEAPPTPTICGGILAEEPGLGKTVETIALILMNPAPPSWNPTLMRSDPQGHADINAIKSTLIVTPPALASQWIEELATHAPSLKVLIYEGWNKVRIPIVQGQREYDRVMGIIEKEARAKKRKQKQLEKERAQQPRGTSGTSTNVMDVDDVAPDLTRGADGEFLKWCDYVHQYDVVITTYSTLRSEIHAARPGRERYKGDYLRSPLIVVEWKRVVMDEVQMVGGGSAAEMVSLIPRLSSLAVSGTPAKAQVSDLIHVLKFLRVDQLVGGLHLCKRLLKPGFSEDFASFLQHYGIRTTKSSVTNELTIPEQTRYLVGIELGRVERHVYDQALEKMLFDLGLDARGVAANSDWQVDGVLLRSALRNLRGICTHPQVGQLLGRNDGYKPNALKTMDAVLQVMQDQNWKNLVDDWTSKIELLIRQAQLEQKDDTVQGNYRNALETLQLAGKETNKFIEEIKDVLAKHDEKSKEMITEAARLRQERADETTVTDGKGKGKATSDVDDSDEESTEDETEGKGLPKTPAGEEHKKKGILLKERLRKGYLLLHRVHFLQGDVYHVLGDSTEEDSSYQNAEKVRQDLLKHAETEASSSIARLASTASNHNLRESDLLVNLPLLQQGGIKSSSLVKELNDIVDNVLNKQAELLWKWRSHIMGLLTQPLNPLSGQSEADGQEFQRTLDDQGEVEIYFQCYVALLADRREALINERTLLAAHTLREKQGRNTKAAMKAASAAAADLILLTPEGLDIEPEHEVMHSDLTLKRKKLLRKLNGRAVRSILVELNGIYMSISDPKHPEKNLLKGALDRIRSFTAQQTTLHDKLETDLNLLRKSFNQRIRYYWQLQEISDSVADVIFEEPTVAEAVQVCVTGKADLDAKMNTARARFRYLENLSNNKDSNSLEDEKECVLCRCEFIRGYITHCGHVFCEVCMKAWLYKKVGKTCPVCRIAINTDTVQRFIIDAPAETDPPPRLQASGEPVPKSHRTITYSRIDPALFEDIQTMETYGDFGSKIQTLVRHLAHLKLVDPGSKSIVFSAWADSLNIVEHALRENGITTLRIGSGSHTANSIHKFRTDPNILVLLLHGETENAGLNVTCACRVFLLESVVHHSFEIQAIARIDRLGQTRPTEVYCYYAEDTVERNILDLAARKGLSLYTKENSKGTVSVSPFTQERDATIDEPAQKTKLQKGDFIYRVNDMLAILFPHMFEDIEFLLPSSANIHSQDVPDEDIVMTDAPRHIPRDHDTSNAVAGPSRLL